MVEYVNIQYMLVPRIFFCNDIYLLGGIGSVHTYSTPAYSLTLCRWMMIVRTEDTEKTDKIQSNITSVPDCNCYMIFCPTQDGSAELPLWDNRPRAVILETRQTIHRLPDMHILWNTKNHILSRNAF